MAKSWNDVASSPDYQALPPDKKEAARAQYFDAVVAPNVPKEKLDTVRQQFDSSTKTDTSKQDLIKGGAQLLAPVLTAANALVHPIDYAKGMVKGVKDTAPDTWNRLKTDAGDIKQNLSDAYNKPGLVD